eukprot:snap_masked-scaffold_2-processed-gene-0.48-mRNA-1 protein AED:1.00 eAED:1.00 QI:0/0/0/0/1/1/4/0/89
MFYGPLISLRDFVDLNLFLDFSKGNGDSGNQAESFNILENNRAQKHRMEQNFNKLNIESEEKGNIGMNGPRIIANRDTSIATIKSVYTR